MNLKATYLRLRFWLLDWMNGSPIRKPYKEIKYLSEHADSVGNMLRAEKLNSLLDHASQHTAFYQGYSKNLCDYPVMNKSMYIENYDAISVDAQYLPWQKGKVHIQTTSGSTGTPFAVPQDSRKRERRIAELKYFGKIVGFKTHEKLVHLRAWNKWQSKTSRQIKTENIIPFDISTMSENRMGDLCDLIIKERPICLRGYASSFDMLAKYAMKHSINLPSVNIVIAGSEALHDDTRYNIKTYLRTEIISQYANEECGILAQERIPTKEKDNVMYLNHASYIFEFLKLDSDTTADYGELARIVITDLHNYAYPIIRYDTGDVGILLPPNEYSNGYPILGKLYGRRFDVCYTTENNPFSPMALGRMFKHIDGVLQWQFVQTGVGEYIVKIIPDKSNKIDAEFIDEQLREIVGIDAKIELIYVEDITVLNSGKRKMVVNQWKR